MSEGITSLESAFAEAAEESTEVQVDGAEGVEPTPDAESVVEGEQAEVEVSDQPEVAETATAEEDESDLQSLVDMMADEGGEAEEPEAGSDAEPAAVDLSQTVEVDFGDGTQSVTIQELIDGSLRQADYTRKTQELAAQRRDAEDAIEFLAQFRDSPVEFARALATKAGLIEPGAAPVRDVEQARIQSETELEAEVERRVEERLASDPRTAQIAAADARVQVNAEFDRIEGQYGVALTPQLRQDIVDEAARAGTGNLELVFKARLADAQRAADKRRASTSRPKASPATPPSDAEAKPKVPATVDDAFAEALAEAG